MASEAALSRSAHHQCSWPISDTNGAGVEEGNNLEDCMRLYEETLKIIKP